MQFLYILEQLRNPVLDEIMLLVTRLGEETAFLVLALIFFWCVDKQKGYYIMAVGFIGTIVSQFMKLLYRVPRPWVLNPEFTVVGNAKEAATGYSFPSGHSQSAVGTLGAITVSTRKRWLRVLCIVFAVLVPFSRMYLGVHTPADVLVGSGLSLVLIFALRSAILRENGKTMKFLIAVMFALAVCQLLFVERFPFPAGIDPHNLQSGVKNAYTLLGCMVGISVVYYVDSKWIHFRTKAVWWVQIIKVVVGLLLVLLVKEGLRAPLDALFAGHMAARAVRYALLVIVAGNVWPLSFRWLARLGEGK